MSDRAINILLIDDDDVDVRVVRRALERHQITNKLIVANDGVEGLEMLRGEGDREKISQPVLVLLDLNMPRMGGLQFLEELRNDPSLARTIVFVLSTSSDEFDRASAYDKNIAGYLVKSEAGKALSNHMPMLERFLSSVEFPTTVAVEPNSELQTQSV